MEERSLYTGRSLQAQKILCTQVDFCFDIQSNLCTHSTYSELAIFMFKTHNSITNLLPYCGLVDARIRASDEDLPVYTVFHFVLNDSVDQYFLNYSVLAT